MAIISANPSGERASGMYNAYGAYLIDAANLVSLSNSVAQIEAFASKELQAKNFVTKLKSNIAYATSSTIWNNTTSTGGRAVLDNLIELLQLTKVSAAEISSITNAMNILKKYMDDGANYPSSATAARQITTSIANTLSGITIENMYAAMSS